MSSGIITLRTRVIGSGLSSSFMMATTNVNMNASSTTVGSVRIVIAGDGATGKTCLMYAYVKNQFLPEYAPTTFDQNIVEVNINEDKYNIVITDIAGQHDFAKLREPAYSNVDIFVLTYSSISPDSFHNIKSYWIPEIKAFQEQQKQQTEDGGRGVRGSMKKVIGRAKSFTGTSTSGSTGQMSPPTEPKSRRHGEIPTILVATKIDLRDDAERDNRATSEFVGYEQGEKLKDEIGAKCFVECSALTQENIKAVFDNALLIYLQNNPEMVTSNARRFIGGDLENFGAGTGTKVRDSRGKKKRCGPCGFCVVQ